MSQAGMTWLKSLKLYASFVESNVKSPKSPAALQIKVRSARLINYDTYLDPKQHDIREFGGQARGE